jgi:hypothetical protein
VVAPPPSAAPALTSAAAVVPWRAGIELYMVGRSVQGDSITIRVESAHGFSA